MPNPTRRVAIVGGGITGLSLAHALSPSVPVTLLEAGAIATRGASSLPAALLNPHRGRTARAHHEDVAGMDAFWRRDAELRAAGHDTGSMRTGVLRIASDQRQLELWRDTVGGADAVRRIDPEAVPAAYHAPFGAILVRDGGWVQPALLLGALAASSRRAGARIVEGVRVRDLKDHASGWDLATSDGRWRATHVVICTGAEPVPGRHQPEIELERVAGDVVGLASATPFPLPVAGAVYGAYREGTAFVGGNHRPPDSADPTAPEALRSALGWSVPTLRQAEIASVWTGVRAKRRGNRPWSGPIADGLWFSGAMAGRGFLCSAAEAERLAASILEAL
jgi:glycine/D-amino acid oxidase-like deaminating enzyme